MTPNTDEQQDVLKEAQELTDNMLASTKPSAIFGEPVQVGEHTILTASEVGAAMGVGKIIVATGGGGTAFGRPVAVVTAGPDGVKVRPVIDITKIGLAFLTVLGSFLVMWRNMQKRGG